MSEYKYLNELRTEELIDEVKRRLGVRLIVVNEMPESAPDGSTRLYMGETTADYTKGHIYQYNDTERVWNDVTKTVEVIKDVTVLPEGDEIKNIFYNLGADTWTGWNLEVNFDVHPDVIPYPSVPLTKVQFDTIGWVGYNGSSSARNSSLTFFADTKNPDAVKLGWFDGADIVELYAVQYISSYDTQNNAKTRIRLFDTYENYQNNTEIHTYEYIHADVDDKTTFTELRKWESSGIYAGNDTNDKLIRLATYADTIADYELSELSTKPVQNKVVTAALKDKVVRRFEMPVASEDNVGETAIYVGQTTEDYKLGHVYKSTGTLPGEYAWIDITSADVIVDVDELPTDAEIRDIIYRIAEAEYKRVNIPMYENAKDVVDILTGYFGEPEISEGTSGGTLYAFACNPTANCVIRMSFDNYTATINDITNATVIANASGRLDAVKLQTVDDTTGRAYGREVIDGVSNTMRWEMPTIADHYYMGDSTERKLDRVANYKDGNVATIIDMWDIPEKIEDVIYKTRAGVYSSGVSSINGLNYSVSASADIQETIDAFTKFNYVIKERGVRNGFLIQTDTYRDTENEYEYCELTSQYTTISLNGNNRDTVLIQYRTDGTGGYVQLWNHGERYDMTDTTGTFNLRFVIPEEAYWIGNSANQTLTRLATYDDKLTRYKTMPNITEGNREFYLNQVVMYVGETNENYICGHLYKGAILDTRYTYYWQDVTDVPTADAVVWVTDFPTAPDIKNVVYGKITTTTEYTNEKTVGLDSLDTETRITLDGDNYIPASTDDVYVKGGGVSDYEVFVSFNTTTNELTTSGGTYTLAAGTELTFATLTTTETKSFRIGNEERQELTELESGGTEVIANPSETATETLSKVSIDGTVYEVGGDTIQVETLPTAGVSEVGNIYQYVGETGTYTKGYFYECVSDGESTPTYSWKAVISAGDSIQKEELPVASEEEVNNIYQYIGNTTFTLTNGHFYKCVSSGGSTPVYSWEETDVSRTYKTISRNPAGGSSGLDAGFMIGNFIDVTDSASKEINSYLLTLINNVNNSISIILQTTYDNYLGYGVKAIAVEDNNNMIEKIPKFVYNDTQKYIFFILPRSWRQQDTTISLMQIGGKKMDFRLADASGGYTGTNVTFHNVENLKKSFIGTKAEWDSLTAAEKAKYEVVCFTDSGDASIATQFATISSEGATIIVGEHICSKNGKNVCVMLKGRTNGVVTNATKMYSGFFKPLIPNTYPYLDIPFAIRNRTTNVTEMRMGYLDANGNFYMSVYTENIESDWDIQLFFSYQTE